MSEEQVNIEVNGIPLKARKGAMLIEVTDAAGIPIPRFCYHKKLSIAASCRMCLVEVEKAPKAMPACATPVMEGMKVHTESPKALAAQKGTMEFLLINHPLDCPICDQGGECELQDLAVGYGGDVSRFAERKRVVKEKDIGPLIATDMTRCIHCTRCVRFGDEIAGLRELGATGRGENMEIGTYVAHSIVSELSGNVIDLCPVGALTAKPSRYRGRSWEYVQHPAVAPHDSVGSNVFVHTLRGKVMRVAPRENEQVNETWLSDRDRFSYEGIYSDDRLGKPLLGGTEAEWGPALEAAAKGLKDIIARHGFRGNGMRQYERREMQRLGAGWGTEIPCVQIMQPGIDYYISAVDDADSTLASTGSESSPVHVNILGSAARRSFPAPTLPGRPAPASCASCEDCPPGMTGPTCCPRGGASSSARGQLGDPCGTSSECGDGLRCDAGACAVDDGSGEGSSGGGDEPPSRSTRNFSRVSVDLGGGVGGAFLSGTPAYAEQFVNSSGQPVCGSYTCYRTIDPGLAPTFFLNANVRYNATARIGIAVGTRFQFDTAPWTITAPGSSGLTKSNPLANLLLYARLYYAFTPGGFSPTGVARF